MPHKKRANPLLSLISTEPLRQKRVPISLCDLIGNMIDIIHGDLSTDEAYCTVSDVRRDLQLMIDKPERFLYDMDLEKLAVTGLQVNEAVFGREMDLTALQKSYMRSIYGENECAIIVGPSGIGKTVLSNRLGSFASANGAFFLTGKFDQLQQMTPFSALSSAFNEYCNRMVAEGQSGHLQEVSEKLRIALGEEARHLVRVIPNLSAILGEDTNQYDDQDCANAQARIQHLLGQFVDVISSFSGAPIILFLDDLQWSDRASLSAIKQLMLSFCSKRQFFFLGSCREEGLLEQHSFGSMIASIRQFGVHATVVKLGCLDKDTTNAVVSDLLCLSPRLTRTLSEIVYHKSQGNPFFFSQLMILLCRDGLVRLSLSRRRWEWDEEQIQSMKLPDNIAAFLSSTIERLPTEVQSALYTLSCLGARSDCVLLEVLEAKININLTEPLQIAVALGIIDRVDGKYTFGHDKLQEAAYNLIRTEDRCFYHCKYGLALIQHALERDDDDMLFTAVNQINLGGPVAILDAKNFVVVANLNLSTGIKAMEMSDFSSAYSFFDHGINFLRKRHWQEHYDLSLRLFEAAGKCALVNGDGVSLKLISDQIFNFAKSFEDKLNTMFYNVTALAYSSKLPESVEMAISVLSQLGIELPASSESEITTNIEQTKLTLQGFTDQELIDYKIMIDPSMIMAMKFLARLVITLYYTRPAGVPITTLKMIQLSIYHGMSPVSPIGFTYFGQLVASSGDIEQGCRYVNIARKLLDRIGSKDFAGEVIAMGSQLSHFVKPIQVTVELHAEGYTIAMAAGDMFSAMLNLVFYSGIAIWSTHGLTICHDHISQTCRLLEQHGQLNLLSHMIQLKENIQLLMSEADGQEGISKSPQVEEILKNANHHGSISFISQKMYIHFMFREYDDMKLFAEKFFSMNDRNWILLFSHVFRNYYGGIVSFWVYRQTKDSTWIERGRSAKVIMKKWAESSHHNFQHKVYLLEAEEAFCNNDTEGAQLLYEKAVSTARDHR
jgi:predicted ATPase